ISPSRWDRAAGLGKCPCRVRFLLLQRRQTTARRTDRACQNKPWGTLRRVGTGCCETWEGACARAGATIRSRVPQPRVPVRECRFHNPLENRKYQHALSVLRSRTLRVWKTNSLKIEPARLNGRRYCVFSKRRLRSELSRNFRLELTPRPVTYTGPSR